MGKNVGTWNDLKWILAARAWKELDSMRLAFQ